MLINNPHRPALVTQSTSQPTQLHSPQAQPSAFATGGSNNALLSSHFEATTATPSKPHPASREAAADDVHLIAEGGLVALETIRLLCSNSCVVGLVAAHTKLPMALDALLDENSCFQVGSRATNPLSRRSRSRPTGPAWFCGLGSIPNNSQRDVHASYLACQTLTPAVDRFATR